MNLYYFAHSEFLNDYLNHIYFCVEKSVNYVLWNLFCVAFRKQDTGGKVEKRYPQSTFSVCEVSLFYHSHFPFLPNCLFVVVFLFQFSSISGSIVWYLLGVAGNCCYAVASGLQLKWVRWWEMSIQVVLFQLLIRWKRKVRQLSIMEVRYILLKLHSAFPFEGPSPFGVRKSLDAQPAL